MRTRILPAVLLTSTCALCSAPYVYSQSSPGASVSTQLPTVPQWQIDAGGKMSFDVASVKPNKGRPPQIRSRSNVPLDDGDGYPPNGGLFSATDWPLSFYIRFAYKVTEYGYNFVLSQLPDWAIHRDWYDIQARGQGNATKDQMRLMMQSLLKERFNLTVHWETRQSPVLALVLLKPGKTGPKLTPHSTGAPCPAPALSQVPSPVPAESITGNACDVYTVRLELGQAHVRITNETMDLIAGRLTGGLTSYIDRPVVNQTELRGHFDFGIDFTPDKVQPNFEPDTSGPTFLEALQEQAGLKLAPQTGPVNVLVIDHIEEPSPN